MGQRDTVVMKEWSEAMKSLGQCNNVMAKLGGCGMPIFGLGNNFHLRVTSASPSPSSDELVGKYFKAKVFQSVKRERVQSRNMEKQL